MLKIFKDRYLKIDLSDEDDFIEYAENNSNLGKAALFMQYAIALRATMKDTIQVKEYLKYF